MFPEFLERFLAVCRDERGGSDAVTHGPGAVACELLHQEVVVSALDFDDTREAVHGFEETFAVGEVVARARERKVHGETGRPCNTVNQRLDRLHADDER